jgi:hypothetical protein
MPKATLTDEQDSPWKEVLEIYFQAFLAFFFPEAHAEIDWSRPNVLLDKELQKVSRQAAFGPRTVDQLVQVWLRGGEEAWVLIHVEVQSQHDATFAERMYVCNCRLFDRYHRRVASLAVLADDRASCLAAPCHPVDSRLAWDHDLDGALPGRRPRRRPALFPVGHADERGRAAAPAGGLAHPISFEGPAALSAPGATVATGVQTLRRSTCCSGPKLQRRAT